MIGTLNHCQPEFSPTKDGAGLTQGPVSRKLPTGLAGLAGLTMRGAWGGGVEKEGSDGAGPPVLSPTRQTDQTDLAWFPGIAAPPTTTHTHAHKVLARGGMPGWVGMGAYMGRQGTGPSGIQMWEGCPRWGGHTGTSAPPWQKEGEASTPPTPPI